jgi:hypothetical protein
LTALQIASTAFRLSDLAIKISPEIKMGDPKAAHLVNHSPEHNPSEQGTPYIHRARSQIGHNRPTLPLD